MVEMRKIKNPFVVKVFREFNVKAEQVFDAWVDPVNVGNWLFATPEGTNKLADIDPREGGKFMIGEQRGEEFAKHVGTYHVIERPSRLVFSYYYGTENEGQSSNVIVDISETDVGCLVTITHEMDDIYAEYEQSAVEGWNMIFDGLNKTLS